MNEQTETAPVEPATVETIKINRGMLREAFERSWDEIPETGADVFAELKTRLEAHLFGVAK